jgi:hypothetical protein
LTFHVSGRKDESLEERSVKYPEVSTNATMNSLLEIIVDVLLVPRTLLVTKETSDEKDAPTCY